MIDTVIGIHLEPIRKGGILPKKVPSHKGIVFGISKQTISINTMFKFLTEVSVRNHSPAIRVAGRVSLVVSGSNRESISDCEEP